MHIMFNLSSLVFDPALVSLALTYVISLGGMLQFCVRQSAEVESLVSTGDCFTNRKDSSLLHRWCQLRE